MAGPGEGWTPLQDPRGQTAGSHVCAQLQAMAGAGHATQNSGFPSPRDRPENHHWRDGTEITSYRLIKRNHGAFRNDGTTDLKTFLFVRLVKQAGHAGKQDWKDERFQKVSGGT